jgi:chondroitin AC lyase
MKLRLLFLLGMMAGPGPGWADAEKIFSRLDSVWLEEPAPKGPESSSFLKSLREDGTWPDIEYDGDRQPGFRAFPHVERMARMAWDFRTPGETQGRPELAVAFRKALSAWVRLGLKPKHEWFYTMGVPLSLSRSLVLMRKQLSPEEIRAAVPLLRVSLKDGKYVYGGHPATGANLAWSAGPALIGALLAGETSAADHAARALAEEIKITQGEGIQADFSFHQHGPLLYSGGYGGAFVGEMARWAYGLAGTSLAFPDAKVEILADTLLEGEQFMIRGDAWDYGVVGREIARPRQGARGLQRTARQMAEAWPQKARDFEALRARILGETNAPPLIGNRMFWRTDYMAHARSGFQASARMSSTRIKSHESGNGENELGYHLGDGAFCLMRDGNEYRTVFPLWNWRQIPGTTVPQSKGPLPVLPWGKGSEGGSPFAGGVSDGTNGVAGMILRRDGLEGRKAWFFFEDEILCLGSGIRGPELADPVYTTINQTLARGEIITSKGKLQDSQVLELPTPGWFQHDGVGYGVLRGPVVRLTREKRSGTWKKIQRLTAEGDTPAEAEVFTAWLDHGSRPAKCEYAYAVLPEISTGDDFLDLLTQRPMEIRPGLLAASDRTGKILGMIFFEPGKAYLPEFPGFETDRACAVLLEKVGDRWSGRLASPTHEIGTIQIRFDGGNKAKVKTLEFPAGDKKGSSVPFNF